MPSESVGTIKEGTLNSITTDILVSSKKLHSYILDFRGVHQPEKDEGPSPNKPVTLDSIYEDLSTALKTILDTYELFNQIVNKIK